MDYLIAIALTFIGMLCIISCYQCSRIKQLDQYLVYHSQRIGNLEARITYLRKEIEELKSQ